jgi:uncharacterized protein YcbX
MPDYKLTQIWIYPIKSLGGISLLSAQVMGKGLQHDRRRMLINETNAGMTQRTFPKMALFKTSISNGHLNIKYGPHELSVDLEDNDRSHPLNVNIWDDQVEAFEVRPRVSQWFSEMLSIKCKLVFFPENNSRPVDPRYKVNDENVSLADAYPFVIIGQSSLDDLNSRLVEGVPIDRFRPNFVFEGGKPYEEDSWRTFAVGDVRFVGVKLCARCILPTVNQETAERGVEPLKTLSSYRKWDNKVHFGRNLVVLDNKTVNVGDRIVLEQMP